MKVLVTGSSQGIGKAIAEKFLNERFEVIGFDRELPSISHENYKHYLLDVRDYQFYPEIDDINILINNAGTQNEDDIDINLKALIKITEKYGVQKNIRSTFQRTS